MLHGPLTRVITPYSLPSIAALPCAQRYYNEGRPVLLPVPFHRVYVLALYFDHGIYRWIFCATVAEIRDLPAELGRSG